MAFHEVAGHRRLLSLLSRAIVRDTLAPSLLLSGPDGVGKRLTALSIAQALNCASRRPPQDDACGTCSACLRIARGAHPDVVLVEPGDSGSIKIEQIRAAVDQAVFRPFEGRRRVTVIDQADALVEAAQNALLKTLEEPLPASVFVLVSSRPDALLPTVRSRCAHLRFGRLQAADVAAVLEKRHGYSASEARAAAAAADGSVRRALDLEAGDYADARSDAEDLLRVSGRDARTRLERAKAMLKGGGTPADEREHLAGRLEALASVLRDLALMTSGADARLLANLDRRDDFARQGASLGADRLSRAFAAVTRARDALDRNVSPKVVADWLAVQL